MTSAEHELYDLLISNYLFYNHEIELISENSDLPYDIKKSVEVTKISLKTYVIRYLFFGRIIEYVLSFDNDEEAVKIYLNDGHYYNEFHTNLYVGDSGLTGKRNIYGGFGQNISLKAKINPDLIISKIAVNNGEVLSDLKEEISGFESYEFIKQAISSGSVDFFAAMKSEKCVAYMHMGIKYDPDMDKRIILPTIYTAKSERKKGVASELLTTVICENYSDCCIVYGVDAENTASNKLAQKIGLMFLGTKYRYTQTV